MTDPGGAEPAVNVAALFDPVVSAVPDRVALVIGDEAVTYGALGRAVASAAAALRTMGVGRGQRVALVDEASLLLVATVLGAARVGAAAAPMNHRLARGELRALHELAGCSAVAVAGRDHVDAAGAAFGRSPLTDNVVLGWGGGDAGAGAGAGQPDTATVEGEDAALVLFSSGTTGLPKPVVLTHGELGPRVRLFSAGVDPGGPASTALMCVPAIHVGGLVGLLVGLAGGTTTVVQRRFDAGGWLRLVAEHGVERTFLVPAMLRRILDHPEFASTDLSSLQAIAYGAAPADPALVTRAVETLPHVAFSNVFGQTETLGAVTVLGPDDHRDPSRIGSVGRPMPGVEWRIVDPDTGGVVAEGAVGELEVRQGDRWHATGDLVRTDADGYLWAEGRRSDTINRGGEKLGPVEVESVLSRHPAVVDCAVAGYPDEELGERVGAVVVADQQAVGPDELIAWCAEHLAPWKVPDRIVFVDEIPLTELGKVRRADLF